MSIKDWKPVTAQSLPTRDGHPAGKSVENNMLQSVGGFDTIRTKIRKNIDGSTTTLRTRNGMPEFKTVPAENIEQVFEEDWTYDFNSLKQDGAFGDCITIPKTPTPSGNFRDGYKIRRKGIELKGGSYRLQQGESKYTTACRGPNYWYNETDLVTWHGMERTAVLDQDPHDPPAYWDREITRGAVQEGVEEVTEIILSPYPAEPHPDTRVFDYNNCVIAACVVRSPTRGKIVRIAVVHQDGSLAVPGPVNLYLAVQDYYDGVCVSEHSPQTLEVNPTLQVAWSPDGCKLLLGGYSDGDGGSYMVTCSTETAEFSFYKYSDKTAYAYGFTKDNRPCQLFWETGMTNVSQIPVPHFEGYTKTICTRTASIDVWRDGASVYKYTDEEADTYPVFSFAYNYWGDIAFVQSKNVFSSFFVRGWNKHCFYSGCLAFVVQKHYQVSSDGWGDYSDTGAGNLNTPPNEAKAIIVKNFRQISTYSYSTPLSNEIEQPPYNQLYSTVLPESQYSWVTDYDEKKNELLVLSVHGSLLFKKGIWKNVVLNSSDYASLNFVPYNIYGSYKTEMCFFSNLSHY